MSNLIETETNKKEVEKNKNEEKYDEKFEGYYVVTSPAVNLRTVPNGKKPNTIVKALLQGEKPLCDGKFISIDGKRWLHMNHGGTEGYILDKFVRKL